MSGEIRNVGVVGAGTMGSGIAQAFAAAGYSVTMRDLKPEFVDRGTATITRSLERLIARGKLKSEERDATLARIRSTTDLAELAGSDMVVEAILENFELKANLVRELDKVCRANTIFATNTSSISVTQIAAASSHPERVIGMHFFNPVPLMQLVEIIRALQTGDEVCKTVIAVAETLGKQARIAKDSYGFVVNRVLVPMINEAINCVHEGIASPDDVDAMMKLGASHPIGPLALADLIGLDIVLDVMETLYQGFNDPKFRPSPLLKQMCHAGYLGRKTGRGFFRYEKG